LTVKAGAQPPLATAREGKLLSILHVFYIYILYQFNLVSFDFVKVKQHDTGNYFAYTYCIYRCHIPL